MNDYLPGETAIWQRIEGTLKNVLGSYGYSEIRLPIVEQTPLFKRAIGEVTDVVEKEMYTFEDRNGDSLTLCPEVFGGLPTPRKPSEIVNGEVRTCEGISVDREFRLGAQRALDMCEQAGGPEEIAACILQDRSPSCGAGRIYDGTFSGTLTAGNGVFVDLLLRHGYRVIPASEFDPSMLEQ